MTDHLGVAGRPSFGPASGTPRTAALKLDPGTHTFKDLRTDHGFEFTVTAAGTVAYDPALETILDGDGTTTLTIHGAAITLDAQALFVSAEGDRGDTADEPSLRVTGRLAIAVADRSGADALELRLKHNADARLDFDCGAHALGLDALEAFEGRCAPGAGGDEGD